MDGEEGQRNFSEINVIQMFHLASGCLLRASSGGWLGQRKPAVTEAAHRWPGPYMVFLKQNHDIAKQAEQSTTTVSSQAGQFTLHRHHSGHCSGKASC